MGEKNRKEKDPQQTSPEEVSSADSSKPFPENEREEHSAGNKAEGKKPERRTAIQKSIGYRKTGTPEKSRSKHGHIRQKNGFPFVPFQR